MSFKSKFIDNVLNPHNSQNVNNSIGKIISYDNYSNRATVLVSSSGEFNVLEDVPVQLSGAGIMSSKPQENDLVYVQYNNGSVFQPKIVGFADEDYQNNTREKSKHVRKGSLLRTIEEKDGEVTPRSKRRIDTSNNPFKHFDYKEADALEAVYTKSESLGRFSGQELGLFHPTLSSLVKLKDNGDIDIFTGTNVGIRIRRSNKTIEMFGDTTIESEKWKVVTDNVIISSSNMNIDCKKLNMSVKEMYINKEKIDV